MMKFNIRQMVKEDAVYTAEIEKECFSKPWNENNFIESLNNGLSVFFVAECENEITGFIGADNISGEVYISNIAVKEKYRKNGIGTKLIEKMIEYCENEKAVFITLEVRQSNENAIRLYSSAGFENLGIRKNFYSAPVENAYIMTKFFERNDL